MDNKLKSIARERLEETAQEPGMNALRRKENANKKPIFAKNDAELFATLRSAVDLYFKERKLTPKANRAMALKTAFCLALFISAYTSLFVPILDGWLVLWKYLALGLTATFAIMNSCHDAVHGTYSSTKWVNSILSIFLDVCGKSTFLWGRAHVMDHHNFTNIGGHDYDLKMNNPFLRLCPASKFRSHFRFQHLYALILYCLYPLSNQFFEIKDALKIEDVFQKAKILSSKMVHFFTFLAFPQWFAGISFAQTILGYVVYTMIIGLIGATVFHLAHLVENVSFPAYDNEGKLEDGFLTHQLKTTANFSTKSWMAHFLFGGLNYQIEHHLFPHICHIHLAQISRIVRPMVQKHGLPYHENETAWKAICSHLRTLKRLGSPPKIDG